MYFFVFGKDYVGVYILTDRLSKWLFYPIINTKKNENRRGEGEDLEKMY